MSGKLVITINSVWRFRTRDFATRGSPRCHFRFSWQNGKHYKAGHTSPISCLPIPTYIISSCTCMELQTPKNQYNLACDHMRDLDSMQCERAIFGAHCAQCNLNFDDTITTLIHHFSIICLPIFSQHAHSVSMSASCPTPSIPVSCQPPLTMTQSTIRQSFAIQVNPTMPLIPMSHTSLR